MKKGYIITGGESTGSVFISKCISESLGFPGWDGYRYFEPNEDTLFLHRSQPYGVNGIQTYSDYDEISKEFLDYKCKYIICTRDLTCSNISKVSRFSRRTPGDLKIAHDRCRSIISNITKSGEEYFIWSYETMNYMGSSYFDLLYDFLEIDNSNRLYYAVIDGNKKYFK
jgi:hypothetical protein